MGSGLAVAGTQAIAAAARAQGAPRCSPSPTGPRPWGGHHPRGRRMSTITAFQMDALLLLSGWR